MSITFYEKIRNNMNSGYSPGKRTGLKVIIENNGKEIFKFDPENESEPTFENLRILLEQAAKGLPVKG